MLNSSRNILISSSFLSRSEPALGLRGECSYKQAKEERDAKWTKLFEKLLAEGRLRVTNIPRIINTINQLFYGIIFTNIFQTDEASFETRMNAGIDLILYGILLPEGST